MSLKETLLEIDHRLAAGGGDTYREHLVEDAIVIVPGQMLDREATAVAIDASPGWDSFSIEDGQLLPLGAETAAVSYRFEGERGDDSYSALMTSVYVNRAGSWMLALHQQTPLG